MWKRQNFSYSHILHTSPNCVKNSIWKWLAFSACSATELCREKERHQQDVPLWWPCAVLYWCTSASKLASVRYSWQEKRRELCILQSTGRLIFGHKGDSELGKNTNAKLAIKTLSVDCICSLWWLNSQKGRLTQTRLAELRPVRTCKKKNRSERELATPRGQNSQTKKHLCAGLQMHTCANSWDVGTQSLAFGVCGTLVREKKIAFRPKWLKNKLLLARSY